LKLSSNKIAE